MVDVEKHCWEVECEEVCIPAVRFPWEPGGNKLTLCTLFKFKCDRGCNNPGCNVSKCDGGCTAPACSRPTCGCAGAGCATCCPPKCGFVVAVRDLKKKNYTAKACEYSISMEDPRATCCDACSSPGCPGCGVPCAQKQQSKNPTVQLGARSESVAMTPLPPKPTVKPLQSTPKESGGFRVKLVSLKSRLFGTK